MKITIKEVLAPTWEMEGNSFYCNHDGDTEIVDVAYSFDPSQSFDDEACIGCDQLMSEVA